VCTVSFMEAGQASAVLRIGELSRRLGVSDHVLRAWERRYGLLRPMRSPGGFRLYSEDDERRVRRMQAHLARGLSAAQAARTAIGEDDASAAGADTKTVGRRTGPIDEPGALARAMHAMDEPAAQAALDRLLADFTVETVLRDVVLPYLHAVGDRWERGQADVAQEHFASNLLRGRLANLARGWGNGHGPTALLACPPSEEHDLPLLAFGIVLNRNGWRVSYLGANTPLEDLTRTATELQPDLIVLAAVTPERFNGVDAQLSRLARIAQLALAGAGATHARAHAVGAHLLDEDPVTAAEQMPSPRQPSPDTHPPRGLAADESSIG
jgi:MerR family transcriptional regulator, light-induced transcriptional regulator